MNIAIIGAGAAGCFAAANIPFSGGNEVVVFEKTGKALQKVKASGGGRCNVTHDCPHIPDLLTCYPRGRQLLRKSLYQFSPADTVEWFRQRGVVLKTEADGRMFPVTDSSQTIIDCLWREMMTNKVNVLYNRSLQAVKNENGRFSLHFSGSPAYVADKVLIATGGFPKREQYQWLLDLGHTISEPVPSLFTFNIPGHPITGLMGVSVPNASIKIAGSKITQTGPLLITHWGLSGPAVLKTSAIAARELAGHKYNFNILVNWLNETDEPTLKETLLHTRKEHGKQLVQHRNPFELPRRLWDYLLQRCSITAGIKWGELPATAQNKLVQHLLRDNYSVNGKTTFKEEFVTCGGITLSEIDPQTMQSRIVPGIYFAGEIIDVDGITGGYNFQHAWSSGRIAAKNIL